MPKRFPRHHNCVSSLRGFLWWLKKTGLVSPLVPVGIPILMLHDADTKIPPGENFISPFLNFCASENIPLICNENVVN